MDKVQFLMNKAKQFYKSFRMQPGSIGYSETGEPDWWSAICMAFRVAAGGFAIAFLVLMFAMVITTNDNTNIWMAAVGTGLILYILLYWIWPDQVFVFPAIVTLTTLVAATFAALASDPAYAADVNVIFQILMVAILPGWAAIFACYLTIWIIRGIIVSFTGGPKKPQPQPVLEEAM